MIDRPTPGYAGFARLYWMFLGPMLLLILAVGIVDRGGGWLDSTRSLLYLAMLGLLVVCRWAEFQAGDPRTSDGEPATGAHLRRYAALAIVLGSALWAAANLYGEFRRGE